MDNDMDKAWEDGAIRSSQLKPHSRRPYTLNRARPIRVPVTVLFVAALTGPGACESCGKKSFITLINPKP